MKLFVMYCFGSMLYFLYYAQWERVKDQHFNVYCGSYNRGEEGMGCQFQMEVCRHMIDSHFKMKCLYLNITMNYECMHCDALHFYDESTNRQNNYTDFKG